MDTMIFNKGNWSGDTVVLSFDPSGNSFRLNDKNGTLGEYNVHYKPCSTESGMYSVYNDCGELVATGWQSYPGAFIFSHNGITRESLASPLIAAAKVILNC